MAKTQPDQYHTITPYLILGDASKAIAYYVQVFGARELYRLDAPGGRIGHAEIRIGDSIIMLADEHPEEGIHGPQSIGGTPVSLLLYVEDVDTVFKKAIAAGATERRPLQDQFYGDRTGTMTDPFGHVWTIATHIEDVSPEEMDRRMKSMMEQQS